MISVRTSIPKRVPIWALDALPMWWSKSRTFSSSFLVAWRMCVSLKEVWFRVDKITEKLQSINSQCCFFLFHCVNEIEEFEREKFVQINPE